MIIFLLASCSILFFVKALVDTSVSGRVAGNKYNRYGILSKYIRENRKEDNTDDLFIPLYRIIKLVLFGLWLTTIVILKIIEDLPSLTYN